MASQVNIGAQVIEGHPLLEAQTATARSLTQDLQGRLRTHDEELELMGRGQGEMIELLRQIAESLCLKETHMPVGLRTGLNKVSDGNEVPARALNSGAMAMGNVNGWFQEAVLRGQVFSMALAATTTGVAAGQLVAAAAAASTQFALFNPAGSGKNLVLWKYGQGVISGTPGAGPVIHSIFPNMAVVGFTPSANVIRNHATLQTTGSGSVAAGVASAAGLTLTGALAPVSLRLAAFSTTGASGAYVAAAAQGPINAIELLDGDIIIPPGFGWAPLHTAAGTSLLHGYSVTWEEVPLIG